MLGIEGSIQAGTVDRSIYWTKGTNVRQRSQDGAPGGERATASVEGMSGWVEPPMPNTLLDADSPT